MFNVSKKSLIGLLISQRQQTGLPHGLRRRVERLRCSVYPPPKKNGAIVRVGPTDSVRTKAYLQNSETCMRNLH